MSNSLKSFMLPDRSFPRKYMLIGLLLRLDIVDSIRRALAFDMLENIPAPGTNHVDRLMCRWSTSTSSIRRPCIVRRHYKILSPVCICRETVASCVVHCISGNIRRVVLSASIADIVILDTLFSRTLNVYCCTNTLSMDLPLASLHGHHTLVDHSKSILYRRFNQTNEKRNAKY